MPKSYIIFGASSGIGAACARQLAGKDVRLILVARRTERLESLASNLPGSVIPVTYDLHDLEGIQSVFRPCEEGEFKLDGMVYSAGIDGVWPVKTNRIDRMREMMDVNCFAFVEAAKHFYKKKYSMDGSSIVAISSIASLSHEKGLMSYTASKASLNSVVQTMAVEFASRFIRVNAILPGGVDTEMAREKGQIMAGVYGACENGAIDSKIEKDKQPFGIIPPKIIAEQIAFLLSERAAYITGGLISVSGGRKSR